MKKRHIVLALGAAVLVLAVLVPIAGAVPRSASIDPGNYVAKVTNPWDPLVPGYTWMYSTVKDGVKATDTLTVSHKTAQILGVTCAVISDTLRHGQRLMEKTTDWYAQDKAGNVWYFGEATTTYDRNGKPASTLGSWKSGVDGALPGIYMSAHPKVGQQYAQENYPGKAQDMFRIIALASKASVPYGAFTSAVLTKEWSPLEPGVVSHKQFVRGVGMVTENDVKGAHDTSVLVSFKK